MILEFSDACWSHNDDDWRRSLAELLFTVKRNEQHAALANHTAMLAWCSQHLPLFTDYFRTRIAAAQPRANALTITISPTGTPAVNAPPPWDLNAEAARYVVERPLRLVLENDSADRSFVEATVPRFGAWCANGWIQTEMGGGSAMKAKIHLAAADMVTKWRTFFMFDSDRLHPVELAAGWRPPRNDGCQGYEFEQACRNMPAVRWHRLERRSIENYLPTAVLEPLNAAATDSLTRPAVEPMAPYYNMKKGLDGDEFTPQGLPNRARWARTRDFWSTLHPTDNAALRGGFGRNVSDEFANVPPNHAWPPDVVREMNALADALQDAM